MYILCRKERMKYLMDPIPDPIKGYDGIKL